MATRVKTELTGLSKFESSKFKERRENSWRLVHFTLLRPLRVDGLAVVPPMAF